MDTNETCGARTLRRKWGALVAGAVLGLAGGFAQAANSGIPLSPRLTSVEATTSQAFTAQFFGSGGAPAAGETVTFSNDACGTFPNGTFTQAVTADATGTATIAFTADALGGVVCTLTATAAPAQVTFEVVTWTNDQVELVVSTSSVRPAPGERFAFQAAARMGQYTLKNVDLTVRMLPGPVSVFLEPGVLALSSNTGQSGFTHFVAVPDTAPGIYEIEVTLGTLVQTLPVFYNSGWRFQGLWWVGPEENGWGVSVVQHGDKLFAVIFTYDFQDNPTWYVMPAGTWGSRGATYSGALYQPTGSPFHAYDASAFKPGTEIGYITFDLQDPDDITITYEIQGPSERITDTKDLWRNPFGPSPDPTPPVHEEMWWGGVAQDGWGLPVFQQGRALFSLWYTYGDDGKPTWFSMPDGQWTSPTTFEGRLYATRGSPWLGRTYVPERLEVTDVGPYRLRFNADGTGTFDYTVRGRSGSKPILPFPF